MIKNREFFCSWSGGKDSCLALYRAIKQGGTPKYLLNMLSEEGLKSRSHGLPVDVIKKQSEMLGIPLVTKTASWNQYEKEFIDALRIFKKDGIEIGVFGDIDLEPHLQWIKKACSTVEIESYHPLWKERRRDLILEFIKLGFKAIIVSLKEEKLDKSFLGMSLTEELVIEFERLGIDPAGEEGEFHTVVIDGPIFSLPIDLIHQGTSFNGGYWFLNVDIKE